MKIKIAEKLKPFSHELGAILLLPGTQLRLQIFPALIRVFDTQLITEITLDVAGPLNNFTVELDLEKGRVHVFARTLEYTLVACKEEELLFAILSKKSLQWSATNGYKPFVIHEKLTVIGTKNKTPTFISWDEKPTLSLGCHKAQDWSLIKRRLDLKEILPHWYRLGFGFDTASFQGGTASLLDKCQMSGKMEVETALTHLFQAGFEGILFPRLTDDEHQGFQLPEASPGSPLYLLSEGAKLIESLFFQRDHSTLSFLPKLPPSFHAGRFINLKLPEFGVFHFEWSKKLLKKLIFISSASQTIHFRWQKAINSCRLRTSFKDRGQKLLSPVSLNVEAGRTYYFDHFEK